MMMTMIIKNGGEAPHWKKLR